MRLVDFRSCFKATLKKIKAYLRSLKPKFKHSQTKNQRRKERKQMIVMMKSQKRRNVKIRIRKRKVSEMFPLQTSLLMRVKAMLKQRKSPEREISPQFQAHLPQNLLRKQKRSSRKKAMMTT